MQNEQTSRHVHRNCSILQGLRQKEKCVKRLALVFIIAYQLMGCTEVGSEAWCQDMKDKPKGDWTANEAGDFAKHCIL